MAYWRDNLAEDLFAIQDLIAGASILVGIKPPLIFANEGYGAGCTKFAVDVWIPAFQAIRTQI